MEIACKIRMPLPPMALRPNGRAVWQEKAREVKKYRRLAKSLAKKSLSGECPIESAVVQFVYANSSARVVDPDNIIASMKAAIDGMTDAGVWVDDVNIVYLPPERTVDRIYPSVTITAYAADHEQVTHFIQQLKDGA